jgi:glycine cleavage system H protein
LQLENFMLRLAARNSSLLNAQQKQAFNLFRFIATKKYTAEHEWISVEGDIGTVGISNYAQESLGDVIFVEVPAEGTTVKKKDMLGAVESVKAASDVYAPVSGEVIEANTTLSDNPSLINHSPEEKGWLAKIKLSDPSELDSMMDAAAYKAHCEKAV